MRAYDVVVVGGGIVGASVGFFLARAGRGDVLICERGRPPGLGATTRSGALLRQHHTAACDTRLAVRGLAIFRDWAKEVDQDGDCGYRRTGFAMLVRERHARRLGRNVRTVNEAGGSSRLLTAAELAAAHPALRLPQDIAVAYEPDGGYADPILATLSLMDAAGRLGVSVAEGVQVFEVSTAGGRVSGVRTSLGEISARSVVLCSGGQTALLTRELGVHVPVTVRRVGVARAEPGLPAGALPICIDDTLGTYFRPVDPGGVLFGVPLNPAAWSDLEPAPVRLDEAREAMRRLATRVPALTAAELAGARVGVDAYTPDRRPAIGPLGPAGLWVCTGFSGGGVKLAPAVGELLAGEIVTGEPGPLLEPYRPQRFARGELIESESSYDHS